MLEKYRAPCCYFSDRNRRRSCNLDHCRVKDISEHAGVIVFGSGREVTHIAIIINKGTVLTTLVPDLIPLS